jgi:hypothetical protein
MDDEGIPETRRERKARILVTKFVKRFGKGFGSGVVLYAGVKLVSALLRNPFRERWVDVCYAMRLQFNHTILFIYF